MSAKHKTHYSVALSVLVITLLYYSIADAGNNEPRLIVIGDSLSTTHESWPNFLREIAPRWNIHVMAQNGRTIRDFSIPRDLWTPSDKNETVIYFLGANDIFQRNAIMHARFRLKSHIDFLLERNFKVLLIVPPTLGPDSATFDAANEQHRALVESYRGTRPNLWVYDIDTIWDQAETLDGVHPNAVLSREIAMTINIVLHMDIY
jgi:hypothetical protein